jgi:1,4-dihydroxy-2-naphthoate polyprenyltransferase
MMHHGVMKYLSTWFRAIRTKFLLASLIAAVNGIAISVWKNNIFDPVYGLLTICGVICLHTSVDLFNDYWDYKKGIDTITTRTKFSGGTGVLPEKLLKPRTVYFAAVMFLILGMIVGIYFITVRGVIILLILIFATLSIYFYSTNIANAGLGEVFVTVKGALIVLGSYYVQTGNLDPTAVFVGIIIGLLSACVLLVNSFPDYEADRIKGKKTLTVILGKKCGARVLLVMMSLIYMMIIIGVLTNITPIYSIVALLSLPLAARVIKRLIREHDNLRELVSSMTDMILCSRITGTLTALSFIL